MIVDGDLVFPYLFLEQNCGFRVVSINGRTSPNKNNKQDFVK